MRNLVKVIFSTFLQMENLLYPTNDYPFDDITIKTPRALQGGTFCANLEINERPILIQTPKCKTKSGIHKTANNYIVTCF